MYYDLGKVRLQAGKFKRAIEILDKVIQMQPDHGLAYANRGVAYKSLGEYKRAAVDFQNALLILKDPKRVSQVKRQLEETESRIKASGLGDPQYVLEESQPAQAEWPVQSPYW
jgi:tetratricopeptide (TPR) repeat protein